VEDRLKVLKVMTTITSKVDLKEFARMVDLTPDQTLERIQELSKTGFVRKVGSGYGITEKGKLVLKALNPVPRENGFRFYTGVGQYMGFSAESLKDFWELVKKVDVKALEFHDSRGDFGNWIKTVFDDANLAKEFTRIRELKLKGENLRTEVLRAIESRYDFTGIFPF